MEKIRPSLLAFITVMAMSLGGLGFFAALTGAASVAGGSAIADMSSGFSGADTQFGEEYGRVNRDMQAELLQITQSRSTLFYALFAVHVVIASLLLGGGLLAHRMTKKGRSLLMGAFLVTIVFEIVRVFPTVSVQLETTKVMEKYAPQLVAVMDGPAKDVGKMMGTVMKTSALIGVGFAVVFTLIKISFYTFGLIYLKRNERLFTAA